jgi:hypothetical protein
MLVKIDRALCKPHDQIQVNNVMPQNAYLLIEFIQRHKSQISLLHFPAAPANRSFYVKNIPRNLFMMCLLINVLRTKNGFIRQNVYSPAYKLYFFDRNV